MKNFSIILYSFLFILLAITPQNGRTQSTEQELKTCGTSGTLAARIRDCSNKNPKKTTSVKVDKALGLVEKIKHLFMFKNPYHDKWSLVSHNDYSVWKSQANDIMISSPEKEVVSFNDAKKYCSQINIKPTENFSISFEVIPKTRIKSKEFISFAKSFLKEKEQGYWISEDGKPFLENEKDEKKAEKAFAVCIST